MQYVADVCESQGIAYWVVGSMASMAYGEPRFTNDVDVVVRLAPEQVSAFCKAFPPSDFYCSEPAAREAVTRQFQFNILHPASGYKADIIIPPDDAFSRSEANRIRKLGSEGEYSVWFASPEDVLLNKLVYYRIGGGVSDKHVRDIAGMIKLQQSKLDLGYIDEWAERLSVLDEWRMIRNKVGLGPPIEPT